MQDHTSNTVETNGAAPLRILVIDDNEDLLQAVRFALRAQGGYLVETASDGEQGLIAATSDPAPACVVIDVKMPGLNGTQVIRALRGDPTTADIPLVILSALVQEDDVLRGELAGVDRYLMKPFDIEELVQAINEAVALTAQDREARLQALLEQQEVATPEDELDGAQPMRPPERRYQ